MRTRLHWLGLTVLTIALGLLTRPLKRHYEQLGSALGDALWALMVLLLYGLARPGGSVGRVAASALATSFAVEFSQLYQADWNNAVRHTTPGHLVLGSGFHPLDLLAYTVGVAVGASAELLMLRRQAAAN